VKGLKLRNALPGDMRAVFEFCKSTWPGYGDYIPRVWRQWIADPGSRLIVAELEDRPVGIAKVTQQSPGEIWLEGLRVDPRYRHRGVARALNLEVLKTAKRMRPRSVRFCTGMTNRAPRHMAEKVGFRVAARLRNYWQKARKGKVRGDLARKRDFEKVYSFVVNSRFLKLTSGLISAGWIFREASGPLLLEYLKEKRIMVIRKGSEIAGVGIYPLEENDRALALGFVDGDRASVRVLAKNCMYLGEARGLSHCSISVPTRGFARIIEEAGYRREDSIGQVVYELPVEELKSLSLA
jgi:GNAT superfamily N-acetyltransferase